jgi:hypothetical protein
MALVSTYLDPLAYQRAPTGLESSSLLSNLLRLSSSVAVGATQLSVQAPGLTTNLSLGDRLTIFDGLNSEVVTVTVSTDTLGDQTIQCTPPLAAHASGTILCGDGIMGSLADQIVNASATLENICRQSLWISTYTNETLRMPSMRASIDNQGMLIFRPRHFPVIGDSGITIKQNNSNPVTYDATQIIIDGEAEVVSVPWVTVATGGGGGGSTYSILRNVTRSSNLWLQITYNAGWAAMPGDVTEAMICLVSDLLGKRSNPLFSQNFSLEGKTIQRVSSRDIKGQGGLYARALELLSPYVVRQY